MGAHAFAPAVPAVAPDAIMLADARAPAVLTPVPLALMLALPLDVLYNALMLALPPDGTRPDVLYNDA